MEITIISFFAILFSMRYVVNNLYFLFVFLEGNNLSCMFSSFFHHPDYSISFTY